MFSKDEKAAGADSLLSKVSREKMNQWFNQCLCIFQVIYNKIKYINVINLNVNKLKHKLRAQN